MINNRLITAAKNRDTKQVELILKTNPNQASLDKALCAVCDSQAYFFPNRWTIVPKEASYTIVNSLLKRGANINAIYDNRTPLGYALPSNECLIIHNDEKSKEKYIKSKCWDNEAEGEVHYKWVIKEKQNFTSFIKFLLEKGASPYYVTVNISTVMLGSYVEYFKASGIKAMHHWGYLEIVKLLVDSQKENMTKKINEKNIFPKELCYIISEYVIDDPHLKTEAEQDFDFFKMLYLKNRPRTSFSFFKKPPDPMKVLLEKEQVKTMKEVLDFNHSNPRGQSAELVSDYRWSWKSFK